MSSLQRIRNPRQRISTPDISITPFKMCESVVGDNFHLSSPTLPHPMEESRTDKSSKASLPQKQEWRNTPDSKAQGKINASERKLVSNLARIFIQQQQDKPQRVLIRIKEMANSPGKQPARCRLEKFEISRLDHQPEEIFQDEESSANPLFSFADIPEISKVLVAQPSPPTKFSIEKHRQQVEEILEQSDINIEKSKLSTTVSKLKTVRTVDLRYKPYIKNAYYTKFKAKGSQSQFSSNPSNMSSEISPSKDQIEPKIDPMQAFLFTKLVQLDLLLSRQQLQKKASLNRQRVRAITLQQFEAQRKRAAKEKEDYKVEFAKLKSEELKKIKQIEQLANINKILKDDIERLKEKMDKLEVTNRRLVDSNKRTEEELTEAKKMVKNLRRELCNRETPIVPLTNLSNETKNFNVHSLAAKKSQIQESPSPKKQNQIIQASKKVNPTSNSNLPTQKRFLNHYNLQYYQGETAHYHQGETGHYYPAETGHHITQRGELNLLEESRIYDHIASPLVQQEILNFKANEVKRRPQNMVGIRKNAVSREITPQQSHELLRANKSAGRIEHFNKDSDSDNKSYCSNLSRRSLYQRIGYVRKQQQDAAKQSILQDYMLKNEEAGPFQSQASDITRRRQCEAVKSDKSRFKYKASP